MKKSTQRINVFLIHAHCDRKIVHKLYRRMLKDEIDVWLDVERLQPGQDWQHEIHNALLKSDMIVVCLSRGFNKRQGYRYEELKLVLEKAKFLPDDEAFIIPLRLEKCDMPEALHHLQRVDLFESDGYKKLLHALDVA